MKEYIKYIEHKKKLSNLILNDAKNIMNDNYAFNFTWDMEQCRKLNKYNIKEKLSPNNDPEWVYNFSRLEFLRKLIIAYYLSHDINYIHKYKEIFQKVINKYSSKQTNNELIKKMYNYFNINPSFNRTLDISIRNTSLAIDYFYNKDLLNDINKELIIKTTDDAYKKLRIFDNTSNWGIIIVCSYIIVHLILDNKNIDLNDSFNKLIKMLKIQIRDDGSHIECSNMYHIDILLFLLRLIYFCKERKYNISSQVFLYAKKMVNYVYEMSDTNGYQVMYGDSDYSNISTIMYISKKLLKLDYINIFNVIDDYNILYEFQYEMDILNFPEIIKDNRKMCKLLSISGNFIYNDENYCIRSFNDYNLSGHKHVDNGEIILYYKNSPVFIDCGRYTYKNTFLRKYLKGKEGHNIHYADNGNESKVLNRWELKSKPFNIKNTLEEKQGLNLTMQYQFNNKIFYKRLLYILENDIIVISYCKKNNGKFMYSNWNLSTDCIPMVLSKSKVSIKINNKIIYFYTSGYISIKKGFVSYKYNELDNTNKLLVKNKFQKNECIEVTLITDEDKKFDCNIKNKRVHVKLNEKDIILSL